MHGRRHEAQAREKRLKAIYKRRLSANALQKIQTSFIGALSSFERHFGHLWGYRKRNVSDCTPSEVEMRKAWQACRTEILNLGNGQKRALSSEFEQYDVQWNRHRAILTPEK